MTTKVTETDVKRFISEFWNDDLKKLKPDDIFGSLGIDGDDVGEFMQAFHKTYRVNLDDYLWYFHGGEEGHNLGGIFFLPPYDRVERIPVSLALLVKSANAGKWLLDYPEHSLPKRRHDIIFNQVLLVVAMVGLVFWVMRKFL